jgi:hypothetical protein
VRSGYVKLPVTDDGWLQNRLANVSGHCGTTVSAEQVLPMATIDRTSISAGGTVG